MKKSISLILAVIMLFSIGSTIAFAEGITTPKATASNAVDGVKVYWGKVDNAVKYEVYRRVGGSSSWVLAGTTSGTNIVDTAVSNSNYYVYSVRAYDEQGDYSAYSKDLTYTVKCVSTPKLTGLVNDTKGLKLTWSAVSGANYRVYRRGAGSSTWTYLGTTSSTTYTDSKATSGKYWRYTVRAVSNGYYSGFDTNGLYTMRLANPYSIKAGQVQGGVNVTWAKINGATGYRVYRRGAGQTSWTYLGATTGNSFKDAKVNAGQYYRYTVRATRGSVYSGFYADGVVIKVVTTNEMAYDCYKKVLDDCPEKAGHGKVMYDTTYTLYDIDKDGVYELIVNEKYYNYSVYTCVNGVAKHSGDFSSSYSDPLYAYKGNGLVVHDGGMGRYHVEYLWLFALNNGVLSDAKTIITTESNYTYDDLYNVLDKYTPINSFCKVNDYSLLTEKCK